MLLKHSNILCFNILINTIKIQKLKFQQEKISIVTLISTIVFKTSESNNLSKA